MLWVAEVGPHANTGIPTLISSPAAPGRLEDLHGSSDDSLIVTTLDRKCLAGEMSTRAGCWPPRHLREETRRNHVASLAHAELWERSKSGRWRMKLKPIGSRGEGKEAGRFSPSFKLKAAMLGRV